MALKLVTGPAVEPVTLAEMKLYLRVDLTTDDALISTLITAARQALEEYTRRAFLAQTWAYSLDATPDRIWLELPRPPLQSVTSVTYYQNDDVSRTFAATNYIVDTRSEPGRIVLKIGSVWPSALRPADAFVVQYVAGYGDEGQDVPKPLLAAIKQCVAEWYANRESAEQIPETARLMAQPYRVMRL